MARLDGRAIALGVAVQAAITVPPVLLVRALTADDVDASSYLPVVPALLALVVAPAVAGALAGRRRPDAPLLHAAVATAVAWALLAVVTVVRLSLSDRPVGAPLATILTFAPIEVGIGVLGAFFSRPRAAAALEAEPSGQATRAGEQPQPG